MRIQRYIAKDMRSALAQVREALGPDAVILSSGKVGDEVEVVAAVDAEVARAVANAPPAQRESVRYEAPRQESRHEALRYDAPRADAPRAEAHAAAVQPAESKPRRASSQLSESLAPAHSTSQISAAQMAPGPQAPVVTAGQEALANEMKDMRRMLESQLATLAWNDLSRRSPVQAALLKELAQLGITQDLAESLVRKVPANLSFSAARRFALATVARTVQVTGDRWLEKGGVVAFAGPAGAGKTTLLAKLAARWVLRHGPRRV